MIYSIYPSALEAGVPVNLFWDLSLQELVDILEAYNRREKERERRNVDRVFVLSDAIASRIGYLFADKKHRRDDMILKPQDAYPTLYKRSEEEEKAAEKAELEAFKQRRAAAAERWNRRFAERNR